METKLINYLLSEGFVNYAINHVDSKLISQYRDRALRSLKSSSVNRRLAILSHCFTICKKEWGIDVPNPLLSIRRPKNPEPRDRSFSKEEIDKILTCNRTSPHMKFIVELAIETAMRRSEIANIKAEHLKGNLLKIPVAKTKPRTIPLTPKAAKRGSPLNVAKSKGGQVPVDTFKELIEEFSGNPVNYKIPTKKDEYLGKDIQDTGGDVQYWKEKIKKVLASPLVDIKDLWFQCPSKCPRGVTLQPNKRVYRTATMWVERCNELDWMTDRQCVIKYGIPKSPKFQQNFRGKLRVIRYMEAMINAQEKGKLGEFLVRAYYTAAKIKLSKDDLQGPYVKIASGSF